MQRSSIRPWYLVHKWTSLACTAFLLMLCVTGLPLIFHDEIDALLSPPAEQASAGAPSASDAPSLQSFDTMLARALRARPGQVPLFMAFSNDQPGMTVTTAPRPDAPAADMTMQILDRSTGRSLSTQRTDGSAGLTAFLLRVHTDMFLGLKGELLLAAMGSLFLVALISGTVLYAPFMRKSAFGTLRTTRSRRLLWIDYHNLLGIVALAWMSIVVATGIVNALVTPITKAWQADELAAMTTSYANLAPLPPSHYSSLDRAMRTARRAIPGMNPQFVAFPGGSFSSKHHYAIFFQGSTPLTKYLLTTALVDAATGRLTDARPMPWYFKALMLSRPLHFGDYGGLPMKLLWAVLDLFTIAVLVSGLYLWLGRRGSTLARRVREIETAGRLDPVAGE